jgi:hypothetical protein
MEINPNFTSLLQSATAEDSVYHKNNSDHNIVRIFNFSHTHYTPFQLTLHD